MCKQVQILKWSKTHQDFTGKEVATNQLLGRSVWWAWNSNQVWQPQPHPGLLTQDQEEEGAARLHDFCKQFLKEKPHTCLSASPQLLLGAYSPAIVFSLTPEGRASHLELCGPPRGGKNLGGLWTWMGKFFDHFPLTSNRNLAFPQTRNVGSQHNSINSICDFIPNRNHKYFRIRLQLLYLKKVTYAHHHFKTSNL